MLWFWVCTAVKPALVACCATNPTEPVPELLAQVFAIRAAVEEANVETVIGKLRDLPLHVNVHAAPPLPLGTHTALSPLPVQVKPPFPLGTHTALNPLPVQVKLPFPLGTHAPWAFAGLIPHIMKHATSVPAKTKMARNDRLMAFIPPPASAVPESRLLPDHNDLMNANALVQKKHTTVLKIEEGQVPTGLGRRGVPMAGLKQSKSASRVTDPRPAGSQLLVDVLLSLQGLRRWRIADFVALVLASEGPILYGTGDHSQSGQDIVSPVSTVPIPRTGVLGRRSIQFSDLVN
jgi:hypothetical protein